MLLLARLIGVAVLVWFYLSAKNTGESPIKWALLGFIGYWLTWLLVNFTVVKSMSAAIKGSMTMTFTIHMIPSIVAIAACFFIRKKLLADAAAGKA